MSDTDCTDLTHIPRDLGPDADPQSVEYTARLFRALGDPGRLRLLFCLGDGEACVTELAHALGDGMSLVSQRLKLLYAEGLVTRRRVGKHIYYALADDHIAGLIVNGHAHALELHPKTRSEVG